MRPVATLPVNEILFTPAFTRSAPVWPSPITIWSTPSGRPASAKNSPTSALEYGVTSEPLSSTALPATIACAAWFIASTNGPFHGTMMPTTPSGL